MANEKKSVVAGDAIPERAHLQGLKKKIATRDARVAVIGLGMWACLWAWNWARPGFP